MDAEWAVRVRHLEWEGLQDAWEIDILDTSEALPEGTNRIRLWRGAQYQIVGELLGLSPQAGTPLDESMPGTLMPPLTISGKDIYGRRYVLTKGYLDNRIEEGVITLAGTRLFPFRSQLSNFEAVRTTPNREDAAVHWLTEWYINGPRETAGWTRATYRRVGESYARSRGDRIARSVRLPFPSFSMDHALVRYGRRTLIIHGIPKEYGPDWSHCVGIEYKVGKGEIPSRDDREAIAEIVGFILGRRLLNVGHTTYNRAGLPLMELVTEPLGIDIIRIRDSRNAALLRG